MSQADVVLFCSSLERLGVGWTRIKHDALAEALSKVVVEPVVAGPWPFENPPSGWDNLPSACRVNSSGNVELDGSRLEAARTGVTAALLAVADYGTVVLGHDGETEAVSLLSRRHVAVVRAADLVPDMKAAFRRLGHLLRTRASSLILATGPSATADMGELVRGAHGPEHVHVLILEE
jgi:L-lactate dehydrogenase complex protein LldG